jgi:hypothetical protein
VTVRDTISSFELSGEALTKTRREKPEHLLYGAEAALGIAITSVSGEFGSMLNRV